MIFQLFLLGFLVLKLLLNKTFIPSSPLLYLLFLLYVLLTTLAVTRRDFW